MELHASIEKGTKTPESGLNILSETIYQSNFVRSHYDFYRWQQEYVCKFIPHTALVAAWGNFSRGKLQFDISSNIPELHAYQQSAGCKEISSLITKLFEKWVQNGDKWYFHEAFSLARFENGYPIGNKIYRELEKMTSVLVYGFRDKRSGTQVLYAFFNSRPEYETQTSVLTAIMPHLDAALRRVDCLDNDKIIPIHSIISDRESSVMKLVVQGCTNIDIAEELFISVNTVKNHLKNIFKKMHVSSRAEAVAKYMQLSSSTDDNQDNAALVSAR